ncbi:hypothetical protein GF323_02900 [Candidatus Woesearchaeota archaeon]|nr:hypothetical protein [Candidatus Woesearchaeota archaeon]
MAKKRNFSLFLIGLAFGIIISLLFAYKAGITGNVVAEDCSEDELLIEAVDQNNEKLSEIQRGSIYIRYKSPGWNKVPLDESNDFSACVPSDAHNIRIQSCSACNGNKHIEKEMGDNASSLQGKAKFILVSADLHDQNGIIDEGHAFYGNAFANIYNLKNKLVFGCGNCNSDENALRSGDEFIVPYGADYRYRAVVKTGLSNYNNIEGPAAEVISAEQDSITLNFLRTTSQLEDQNGIIDEGHAFYGSCFMNIYNSNNKIAYGCGNCNSLDNAIYSGDEFMVPEGADYNYKPLVKTPLSNYNNIDGNLEEISEAAETTLIAGFITTTVNLNDQNGIIDEGHAFYGNAFANIYNLKNKLVFGCGNCNSDENAMRSGDIFIVPGGSSFRHKALVKTAVSNYNNIDGNIIDVAGASEDEISSTLRKIAVWINDPDGSISADDPKYDDLNLDIIKEGNNKALWKSLKAGDNFLIPDSISYKIRERADPEGNYNDISGSYRQYDSSGQESLDAVFRKITVLAFDNNCESSDLPIYIIRHSNSKTAYELTDGGYFYAPSGAEIGYKLHGGELFSANVSDELAELEAYPSANLSCEEEESCIENWSINYGECLSNNTRLAYYTDENSCNTTDKLPMENGTYILCEHNIELTAGNFDGETTDFSVRFSDIERAVIEKQIHGKIIFNENISINQSRNLDENIEISNSSIFVNSTALPEFNKSATLVLRNVNYVNPIIYKDSEICSLDVCRLSRYENNTIIFNVSHFTVYSVREGPYCGDSCCNNGETCSSCSEDCGSCKKTAETTSGSGGSSSGGYIIQKRENHTPKQKPAQERAENQERAGDESQQKTEETGCNYDIGVLAEDRISFIGSNSSEIKIINRGNCDIDKLDIQLSPELRDMLDLTMTEINGLEKGNSVSLTIVNRLQSSKASHFTGAVAFTQKYKKELAGHAIIRGQTGDEKIKKEIRLNIEILDEKIDKYMTSYLGFILFVAALFILLVFKRKK